MLMSRGQCWCQARSLPLHVKWQKDKSLALRASLLTCLCYRVLHTPCLREAPRHPQGYGGVTLRYSHQARHFFVIICLVSKIYMNFTFYYTKYPHLLPRTYYPKCLSKTSMPGRYLYPLCAWLWGILKRNCTPV